MVQTTRGRPRKEATPQKQPGGSRANSKRNADPPASKSPTKATPRTPGRGAQSRGRNKSPEPAPKTPSRGSKVRNKSPSPEPPASAGRPKRTIKVTEKVKAYMEEQGKKIKEEPKDDHKPSTPKSASKPASRQAPAPKPAPKQTPTLKQADKQGPDSKGTPSKGRVSSRRRYLGTITLDDSDEEDGEEEYKSEAEEDVPRKRGRQRKEEDSQLSETEISEPAKKRGRQSKIDGVFVPSEEAKPANDSGEKETGKESEVSRGRGRPRKDAEHSIKDSQNSDENVETDDESEKLDAMQRKRGRPRKYADSFLAFINDNKDSKEGPSASPSKRGRPRKEHGNDSQDSDENAGESDEKMVSSPRKIGRPKADVVQAVDGEETESENETEQESTQEKEVDEPGNEEIKKTEGPKSPRSGSKSPGRVPDSPRTAFAMRIQLKEKVKSPVKAPPPKSPERVIKVAQKINRPLVDNVLLGPKIVRVMPHTSTAATGDQQSPQQPQKIQITEKGDAIVQPQRDIVVGSAKKGEIPLVDDEPAVGESPDTPMMPKKRKVMENERGIVVVKKPATITTEPLKPKQARPLKVVRKVAKQEVQEDEPTGPLPAWGNAGPVRCLDCLVLFADRKSLTQHKMYRCLGSAMNPESEREQEPGEVTEPTAQAEPDKEGTEEGEEGGSGEEYMCKDCKKLFIYSIDLQQHKRICSAKFKLTGPTDTGKKYNASAVCMNCRTVCSSRLELSMHKRVCKLNDKNPAEKINVKKMYKCSMCAEQQMVLYPDLKLLLEHMDKEHQVKVKVRDYDAKGRQILHTCSNCFYTFNTREALIAHRESRECEDKVQASVTPQNVTQKKVNPRYCNKCRVAFKSKADFDAHKENDCNSASKEGVMFTCYQCNLKFTDNMEFSLHRRAMHPDGSGNVFCWKCNKTFANMNDLVKHKNEFHKNRVELPDEEINEAIKQVNQTSLTTTPEPSTSKTTAPQSTTIKGTTSSKIMKAVQQVTGGAIQGGENLQRVILPGNKVGYLMKVPAGGQTPKRLTVAPGRAVQKKKITEHEQMEDAVACVKCNQKFKTVALIAKHLKEGCSK